MKDKLPEIEDIVFLGTLAGFMVYDEYSLNVTFGHPKPLAVATAGELRKFADLLLNRIKENQSVTD